MTRTTTAAMLLLGLGLTLALPGCEQSTIDFPVPTIDLAVAFPDFGTFPDLNTSPDLVTPAIPVRPLIGMLIDRVGRPGVNLALTNPFNLVPANTPDGVKNQYNAATPGNWSAYAARPYIAENLAVFDGIDGACGNQLLAATALGANRYAALANLLADDRLYINSTAGMCTQYLAVERATVGDCGGYHPSMVAMDVTYNLLAAGNLGAGFTNGVMADMDGGIAATAPFPYLLPPT